MKANWPGTDSNSEAPLDVRRSLFENVLFVQFTYDELESARKNNLVPPELLIEALMVRVAKYECPQKLADLQPKYTH